MEIIILIGFLFQVMLAVVLAYNVYVLKGRIKEADGIIVDLKQKYADATVFLDENINNTTFN